MQSFVQCKGSQNSLGVWVPRLGFRISGTGFHSLLVELEFWIPIVREIPDSLSSKPQDSGFQSKNLLNSGFHQHKFPCFRILCQRKLDSGFQSLVGLRILWAIFRFPKPRIPDFTAEISRLPDCASKKFLASGLHQQKFPGSQNPDSTLTWDENKKRKE